jgi:thiol-disulfide isomerase/thioredoxin
MFLNSFLQSRFIWLVAVVIAVGCAEAPTSTATKKAEKNAPSADELLGKLRNTYIDAESYSDNAILQQRGVSRSTGSITEIPFTRLSLLFGRPNRYSISYEDAIASTQGRTFYHVASDGKRVRSEASELPGQVHEAIAPVETTQDNLIPEPELRQAILQVSLENLFPQLVMLLSGDAEKPLFPRATDKKLLSDEKIGSDLCYRVQLTEPEGKRVLWIDKQKHILRRMEVPIDDQRESLDPSGQFVDFAVSLDMEDITLDPEFDDEAVSIKVPESGRLVRRFVPEAPPGVPEALGKPVKEFSFVDGSEVKVTPASMKDKVGVLEFWGTNCAPCKAHTPLLEEAYQELKDENVAFYAVSTDQPQIPTEVVQKTLESWGASFPLLRDPERNANGVLDVKLTPSLLLVSADGKLQDFHVGMIESSDELVRKVKKLLAGEELLDEVREKHQKEIDEYQKILDSATIKGSLIMSEPESTEAVDRNLPEKLKVEELWKSKLADLQVPGGLAVIQSEGGEAEEIAVIDNGEAVVRYDAEGKKLGRVKLPGSKERVGGVIRGATDAEGKRWFLVTGAGWEQAFLFDDEWKLVMAFPDERHSGIGDAELLDIKGTGSPQIIVGYRGGRGIQAGTLTGERLWSNRFLDHVLNVVEGPSGEKDTRSIWCTSTRGTVVEIDAVGQASREIVVPGHAIVALQPVFGKSEWHCGVSQINPSQYSVVAFNEEGKVQWEYQLPEGAYYALPLITRIEPEENEDACVVAGPDGSLHFLDNDGKLIDRFDYGDSINDLAVMPTDGGIFLWVSAGSRLTAWWIQEEIHEESAP